MIPRVEEFRSAPMTHKPGEIFNPPALTNFLGVVQADVDPIAIRCMSFPPFGAQWISTGALFLNGVYFPATGAPVTATWYPDRIDREARWDGWHVRSATMMPPGSNAVLVSIEVRNEGARRRLEVRLGLRGGVARKDDAWRSPYPPTEPDNEPHLLADGVAFSARASAAHWVQMGSPRPDIVRPTALGWSRDVGDGETATFHFVAAMGARLDDVHAVAAGILAEAGAMPERVRSFWSDEIASIFTESDRYGGALPVLETADEDLRTIYNLGALGVAYFKRESPASFIGRTYDTLMPAFWQTSTFLWDYSLSAGVHALLDPGVMKRHMEHWMATDVHTCFGTEWLTGAPMGGWYSVNDFAMSRMIHEYLRWTGDRAWLDREVPLPGGSPMSVRDHLRRFATDWERFRTPNGLADYGGIGNLLECVETYIHEVAAMNAGNVFGLRTAAEVAAVEGKHDEAADLRARADALVAEIMKLYADGEGYWHTRFPDGELVPVRHCYDFLTVMATMGDDLSPTQRDEMAEHALREFRTPSWMRALSVKDPDCVASTRPDHQWTGAYTAWPPLTLAGLWRAGRVDDAAAWLKDLARSANQGPFGQAHFVEDYAAPESGGAIKAHADLPYITDWSCSSSGAWVQLVIESIFGVRAGIDGTIAARPAFGPLDPDARLRGLRFQGARYDVDRDGLHRA